VSGERTRLAELEQRVRELESDLVRALQVNEALRRVGMAIGTTIEVDPLLELILNTTTDVLDADRATLYMLRDGKLVSRIKKGNELATIEVAIGTGIAGHVAQTGRVLRIDDVYQDERFDPSWDELSGYRTHSMLAVPLKDHRGRTMGVLQVINKMAADGKPVPFRMHDTELLTSLAAQAAVTLEKADLFARLMTRNLQLGRTKERLERSLRDLELLYELEADMGRAETLPDLARVVVQHTGRACNATAGALLFERKEGKLTLYTVNLDHDGAVREVAVRPGEGIAGRAMEHNELIALDDGRKLRDPRRVRERLGISVHSAIAAPLAGERDHVCGALALYNQRTDARFDEDDGALLRLVSANVSTSLLLLQARIRREKTERLTSIGRLLSGLMHDLRTPLTVVSGYLQLMQVTDDQVLRDEYATIVADQFEHIASMQRDLLAFARGEKSVLLRKVYVAKFFEQLRLQFDKELQTTGIQLELDVQDGVAVLDERRMTRALQNLVRNAIEAMPDGGRLTMKVRLPDDRIAIEVHDTGPGIPRSIRRKLFEPFVTAGKATGTGLGLVSVKEIVEDHGGTVKVRSSKKGTCFTVEIPQRSPVAARRAPKASP
jgi:signal transduction histidine kinase